MRRLRAAGLPLIEGEVEDDSDGGGADGKGQITAIIAFNDGKINALIATPSGIIYRIDPSIFHAPWWAFALRNYYIVTGNMHDRKVLCELTETDTKLVKGKVVNRKKVDEPSGKTLAELMAEVAPELPMSSDVNS